MHLAVRVVILLFIISTAIGQKSKYWWLFPKFDENGLNNQGNSATSAFENDLRNGTELTDVNFSVDTVLNLDSIDSNIDIDAENEENQNDNEGSGSSALPKNSSNLVNKTETARTSKTIIREGNDEDLTVDKDLKENQTDADTIALDASQEDNKAEIEREDPSSPSVLEEGNPDQQPTEVVKEEDLEEKDKDQQPTKVVEEEDLDEDDEDQQPTEVIEEEEFDEEVQVEDNPSSKLEDQRNDDEVAFSGESELEDKELKTPENNQAFKERDEAVHEYGDAHPSSKSLLEKLDIDRDETEDSDLSAEEQDKPIHEHGDAHPSSRLELEETESNIEEDIENFEEENMTNSEVFPEDTESIDKSLDDQDNSSSEESNEKSEDKTREEIIENEDFERIVEDDLIEDEKGAAEKQQMERQGNDEFGESIGIEDETNQDEDDPPLKNNEDLDDDVTLHWVNEETRNTNSSNMDNDNSEIMPTAVPIAPMAPIFKPPTCNFDQRPFNLTLLPLNSVNELHGTDTSLLCKLVPNNESEPMPYFRLTWLFEKDDCQRNATNKNVCTTVLASMSYELPNTTYTLSYNLTKLNHTTHTGLYICDAEIYGCQSDNRNVTQTSKALYMRVYIKPNYGFHIGIISSACVLLLAILAGLVSYARRVQRRSKNRYQELLSPADIQYYPSKVLELPNSVYNATTTGFIRMSASSFSSKSSFTSNEEA